MLTGLFEIVERTERTESVERVMRPRTPVPRPTLRSMNADGAPGLIRGGDMGAQWVQPCATPPGGLILNGVWVPLAR